MVMVKVKKEKVAKVDMIRSMLKASKVAAVVNYKGMDVSLLDGLRAKLSNFSAKSIITKNTLAKRALEGTEFQYLQGFFNGPTMLVYGMSEEDILGVISTTADVIFAKDAKAAFVAAGLPGKNISEAKFKYYAEASGAIYPALISVLNSAAAQTISVLVQYIKKEEETIA